MIDVLLPLRPGDNEELRFTLRSLETNYLPGVRDLYVIGSVIPDWLTGHKFIEGNQYDTAPANVYDNIRRGCRHLDDRDRVLIINDDFYTLEPVEHFPPAHRCTLDEHLTRIKSDGWWRASMTATRDLFGGDAWSHELHRPIEVDPALMADLLDKYADHDGPIQWRTMYGQHAYDSSTSYRDGKVYGRGHIPLGVSCISSTDRSFRYLIPQLSDLLPQPSRWEKNE